MIQLGPRLYPDFSTDFKGWETRPARYFLREKSVSVGNDWDKTQLLSLTKRGVIDRDIDSGVGKYPASFEGYQLVEPGNLIFCLFDVEETPRTIGLVKNRGMITSAYTNYEVNKNFADPRFLEYLFVNIDNFKRYRPFYTGLRNTIPKGALLGTKVSLPPVEEQKAIADFLDRELNTLDSAIASQEKLVGLLIERRLATIQAAIQESSHLTGSVTAPLKWHARLRTGGTPSDAQYTAETADGVPWLRPDDLDESGNPSRGTRFFDKTSLARIGMTTPGSILLCCIGATLGKAGIVLEKVAFNQQITCITSSLDSRYLHYQLVTKKQDLKNLSVGNTLPILNNDRLGTLKIVIPTAENQASIARFLDVQTRSMDTAIQKARDLISVLTERRQALISAAITGKIDFRGKN
jgi:type I restriction enzyme S subunit